MQSFFFFSHLKLEALVWQFIGCAANMQSIGNTGWKKEQSMWCWNDKGSYSKEQRTGLIAAFCRSSWGFPPFVMVSRKWRLVMLAWMVNEGGEPVLVHLN